MNIKTEFSPSKQIDLGISVRRRARVYKALGIGIFALALAGISGFLLVRPEGEWIAREKKLTGDEYERYEKLRMAAEALEHKRMMINAYDTLIRHHSEDKGYTKQEKEEWRKEILRHKGEFNTMAKDYNERIAGAGWATRAEDLPRGTRPLPQKFEIYSVL